MSKLSLKEINRIYTENHNFSYAGYLLGQLKTLKEVEAQIRLFEEQGIKPLIKEKERRIAKGIAYDFNKMKFVWESQIEVLKELDKRFQKLKQKMGLEDDGNY